jgi:hypothetical protein
MGSAVRIALVVLLAAVLLPAFASSCPLCKDAKADTDYAGGTASLPHGFYYSILLMVSAPFLVVGGLVLRIWLARRRAAAIFFAGAVPTTAAAPPARLVPDSRGAQP